ncbi:MAG: FecR domain-containing protein [Candidatus Omnitrophica bacterium]|nr:FecR domain-containing protein [Candidatus Omnitrophota bacterium]
MSLAVTLLLAPLASAQVEPPVPAVAGAQVGVAAAVRGSVEVSGPGAVGRVLQSGQPIYLGQSISTGPEAGLQILLLDETVFTIGPNSSIVIDEFVYNPRTASGKLSARVVKGAFRFVTGKIARKHPEDMEVKLPAGTIGIRGTICAGLVAGLAASVLLQGPGPKNNTGDPPGKVNVGNAGQDVSLTRPGFGTRIEGPGSAPLSPFQFSQQDLAQISGALGAEAPAEEGAGEGEAGEGTASEEAGQTTAEALDTLADTQSVSSLSQDLQDESNQSTQAAADTTTNIADGIATKDQLRTVETGIFHYVFGSDPGSPGIDKFTQTVKNGSTVSIVGNLTGDINIDFGARTVGGGKSFFGADTTTNGGDISGEVSFPSHSFSSGSGNATFTSTVSGRTGTFTVNNAGGVVGKEATFNVSFDNGLTGSSRDAGSSSDVTVTRDPGASPG